MAIAGSAAELLCCPRCERRRLRSRSPLGSDPGWGAVTEVAVGFRGTVKCRFPLQRWEMGRSRSHLPALLLHAHTHSQAILLSTSHLCFLRVTELLQELAERQMAIT